MYKLVVISGKLRGEEYELTKNEMILGSDPNSDILIETEGISREHLKIFVQNDVLFIEDQGSANGTFVNGKSIQTKTVVNEDKISLPNTIIQVVFIEERKVLIYKAMTDDHTENDFLSSHKIPDHSIGKGIFYFKFKLMNIIHKFNMEYEWRILFGILLGIFIVITITTIILPILLESKKLLLHEVAKRGSHYAEEIGRINAVALEQKKIDQINTNFLNTEDGVESYKLFDLDGRIVRPIGELNDYISDSFSVEVKDWALRTSQDGSKIFKKHLGQNKIGIGKKIMAFNSETGAFEAVGVITIQFSPKSLAIEAVKSSRAYLESLTTSGLVAFFFFAIVYFLTIRPIEEMKFQIELVLHGKLKVLESKYLMDELSPLRNSINAVLQRLRDLQKDDDSDDFDEIEADDSYILTLIEFMRGAGVPCIILNSEKLISKINPEAEEITGMRDSSSAGLSLLDSAREQGFAATILDLCESSAMNLGSSQEGEYELQGFQYMIFVSSLLGKDNFAKGFYVTFIKDA